MSSSTPSALSRLRKAAASLRNHAKKAEEDGVASAVSTHDREEVQAQDAFDDAVLAPFDETIEAPAILSKKDTPAQDREEGGVPETVNEAPQNTVTEKTDSESLLQENENQEEAPKPEMDSVWERLRNATRALRHTASTHHPESSPVPNEKPVVHDVLDAENLASHSTPRRAPDVAEQKDDAPKTNTPNQRDAASSAHPPEEAPVDTTPHEATAESHSSMGPLADTVRLKNADDRSEPMEEEPHVFRVKNGHATPASEGVEVTIHPVATVDERGEPIEDDIQAEIVPIVIEELDELLPEIERVLMALDRADEQDIATLHRQVHTLKGTVGQVGARRARHVVHQMETLMEQLDRGRTQTDDVAPKLRGLWETVRALIRPLQDGSWVDKAPTETQEGSEVASGSAVQRTSPATPRMQTPRSVRVPTPSLDQMIAAIDEGRLAAKTLSVTLAEARQRLRDFDDNAQRVSRLQRDLELQAEMQMQSRQAPVDGSGQEFDPLEFDRFTHLQELTRLVGEGVADLLEVRRETGRLLTHADSVLAHQRQAIQSTATLLHGTRLVQADTINDRLHNVVWSTAKEMGKQVVFELDGGNIELDRLLLEKVVAPLEHILRNAVAHGIEFPEERDRAGKKKEGTIRLAVAQAADRVTLRLSDDGVGLNAKIIAKKAVEKGLWEEGKTMDLAQAAEMICTPGFSTAARVSEFAGRGVGMDVVRSDILALGGRFRIESVEGQGMTVILELPTSVAQASVLVVAAAGCVWALPIEIVDNVETWEEGTHARRLDQLLGLAPRRIEEASDADRLVLCKDRGQTMALRLDKLIGVSAAPVHPLGPLWATIPGLAGTVVLPDGKALFLLDPFRLQPPEHTSVATGLTEKAEEEAPATATVLVVDDSLTVRKTTQRLLEAHDYQVRMAKNGQEALDSVAEQLPDVMLMDIEMPKMNGLECLKRLRDQKETRHIPVVMITSRTGAKHRKKAKKLGVSDYLGKPFQDKAVLEALAKALEKPPENSNGTE